MTFLLGIAIFVVALLVSVMLHEAGHFATAKLFKMKATQFFIGFGQTLWSRRRGETEYGIKAIPAGGFVKIVGMTDLEEVDPEDEPRSFRNKPGWQRLIVLGAGSFMHFVIALVLLTVIAGGVGLEIGTTTIDPVGPCPTAKAAPNCTARGHALSPAKKAHFLAGDKIVSVAGVRVSSWNQMGQVIRSQKTGTPVQVVVERDGRDVTLDPSLVTRDGHPELGVLTVYGYQRTSPGAAISFAGHGFWTLLSGSASVVASLPKALPDLFSKNRSHTAAGQVSSVVGAANDTGQVLDASGGWQYKADRVLLIIASLNIFVGAFNLLPLLPLDGGHIAVVLYERARAGLAKLRGKPDPGPVDFRRLIPVSVGVFALLVGMGLLLIMADIVNPVHVLQ